MSNLEVYAPAVDNKLYSLHELGESCKLAVHTLFSDDFAAPPRVLIIKVHTKAGKQVEIGIPYDHDDLAWARIDGKIIE
ncbi:hypothetical protein [Castellaniella sp. GW247-6E4]|uniref:hypothetical protein n=1 Tax=Castellaniella sp. GW247-6E4 TaxID=3140380 RepID=UPI003314CDC8